MHVTWGITYFFVTSTHTSDQKYIRNVKCSVLETSEDVLSHRELVKVMTQSDFRAKQRVGENRLLYERGHCTRSVCFMVSCLGSGTNPSPGYNQATTVHLTF